ncbi:STAS domain-containing protein [Maridesulfovibrio zosterae]|uniref:STAS domain-containing protein n=1 Tax=Maridesulfovibrio zosterae TaxID=82171 RepID=UPI000407A77E|nr:hypothetical protein [Maridesulfovibrio zosterae]
MDNLSDISRIKLMFGIPFFSMDFTEFTQTIEELYKEGGKYLFFTASMPWLLDNAKNPLLCPVEADFILAADSNLIAIGHKLDIKIKMPLEYFEFPEQVARICAHYGYSMLHVSQTALKTDILVSDGYVPLSWNLFTHFKTTGKLDKIDARSIIDTANDSKPDIVLINAPPESFSKFLPAIYENINNCLIICIPQDVDRNKVEEKIDNVFSPMLLFREELQFQKQLKQTCLASLPSSITYDDSTDPAVIKITGTLNTQITAELIRMGEKLLESKLSIALDLSSTHAISAKGLEAVYYLVRKTAHADKDISIKSSSDQVRNTLHQSGLALFFKECPYIIEELAN